MGLGTGYSLGLSRRAQVVQRETKGTQPHRWPSGKVFEGCSGEQQEAGSKLEGINDRSEAEGQKEGFQRSQGLRVKVVDVEVCACVSGTRWTGLSVSEARVLACEVTSSHYALSILP